MIGSLRGVLVELEMGEHAATCVVDVHGVGYQVTVGSRHAASLGPAGSEVALAVHTHVREGAITLYGFADAAERRAFETLIAAHGVGPALGVAILSVLRPPELAEAVADGDLEALCRVPGVGRKTAQRLLVELSARLDDFAGALGPAPGRATGRLDGGPRGEVAEVLSALGYGGDEVRGALAQLEAELTGEVGVEELVREALRALAPRR